MRQSDFTFTKARTRLLHVRARFRAALFGSSIPLQLYLASRVRYAREDADLIQHRTRTISTTFFNLNAYSNEQCLVDFRFTREEIPMISRICGWMASMTARNRYRCDEVTATCIMLRRLASPCRWKDLETTFGMHSSKLSEIFWEVIEKFHATKGHLVTSFRKDLFDERANIYDEVVRRRGGALDNCVGFIDGTKIKIARPSGPNCNQRCVYSGHKRCHCLTYQTITCPDGLIVHMFGPVEGRQPDSVLYSRSGLEQLLSEHLFIDGQQFCIYGDSAYILRAWLQTAFPRHLSTLAQKLYNKSMNAVRTSVEWSYHEVKESFTSQDFSRKLQVRKAPIGLLYICSVLLRNFKTCLRHGCLTVNYFECMPPSLERYLQFDQELK